MEFSFASIKLAPVSEFCDAPSDVFVNSGTKQQLIQLAEHYGINAAVNKHKGEIRVVVLFTLLKRGVLGKEKSLSDSAMPVVPMSMPAPGLTFEKKKNFWFCSLSKKKLD